MTGKLVIGYEPTPQGEDALALGALLAEALEARPIVATVLPLPRNLMSSEDLERAIAADTEAMFAIVRDRLERLAPKTRVIASRAVAEGLHELSEAEGARALVVGSSHGGPIGRLAAGSVGESLLHGAACPVAMAPRGFAEAETRSLSRVAVCFDGSGESWAALEAGIVLADRGHGTLTVLTVAEPEHYGYAAARSVLMAAELHNFERQDKRRMLDLAVARASRTRHAEGRLLTGRPGPLLAEASVDFDLLVCGSRGYGSLRRTVLGSTAAKLMRRAQCPVLVIPRNAGLDPLDAVGRAPAHLAKLGAA
jgi:nucleotide-binding universal stress UspA family protein